MSKDISNLISGKEKCTTRVKLSNSFQYSRKQNPKDFALWKALWTPTRALSWTCWGGGGGGGLTAPPSCKEQQPLVIANRAIGKMILQLDKCILYQRGIRNFRWTSREHTQFFIKWLGMPKFQGPACSP